MIVLIIDRNHEDAEKTREKIKSIFHEPFIVEADSCQAAREIIKKYRIDLAVIEVTLPDESGYRILKEIKDNDPKSRAIIYTSSLYGMDTVLGLKLGADDIFVKSSDPNNGKDLLFYLKKFEKNETINHV